MHMSRSWAQNLCEELSPSAIQAARQYVEPNHSTESYIPLS
jgi:hypothetical protein